MGRQGKDLSQFQKSVAFKIGFAIVTQSRIQEHIQNKPSGRW